MKLGPGDYGQASRERRRLRQAAPLILPVLGILAAGALAWVLLRGHPASSRHSLRGAPLQAGTGGPCPGARSCPYTTAAIVGQPDRGLLRVPEALAVGPGGDVYVGDQFSYAVRRFSPRGRLEAEWGSYGSGPGQFGAIGGLAVGPGGDVYVVDSGHDRIERFTPDGRLLDSWGSKGSRLGQFYLGTGPTPDHPPGGAIAVSGGYVYVADSSNDRIMRFDLDGSHPLVLIRGGRSPGELHEPRGLAIADGELYVADDGNRRVEVFNLRGRLLRSVGSFGTGPLQFANPFDLAVDGEDIYVADDNNNRIVELTRGLAHVRTFVGSGSERLGYVRALALGAHGELFVTSSSGNQIMVFGPQGRLLYTWGQPARFVTPLSVAAAPNGSAYVIETLGSQSPISLLDSSLAYRGDWEAGGEAILGSHWFSPSGAAPGTDRSLWVTDTENDLIRHFNAEGTFIGDIDPRRGGGADPLALPADVASGPEGRLYVTDSSANRIEIFSASGAFEQAWGGAAKGQPHLLRPQALAVGANGDSYIADTGEDKVVVLGSDGRPLAAWGRPGTTPGRLKEPAGIAVDAAGHVFVSDTGNDRIEEFTSGGRLLALWGAPGRARGEFDEPRGLAVDCDGKLLVADTRNNRVQAFSGVADPPRCTSG